MKIILLLLKELRKNPPTKRKSIFTANEDQETPIPGTKTTRPKYRAMEDKKAFPNKFLISLLSLNKNQKDKQIKENKKSKVVVKTIILIQIY